MDLLFKRYASPFDYLNILLETGNFARGITNILNTIDEEKNWEYYLSNNPMNDKSYQDWKEEERRKAQAKTPMSKAQIDTTVRKSQNILDNFKLPE